MADTSYLRVILALVFVLALMALLAWAVRRWQSMGGMGSKLGNTDRRLQLVEQFYFEPKRRLVLMRCDDQEHLILLGQQGETLIESRAVKNRKAEGKKK